ncbi:unnamed protein product, partial [marine sediment metagenome]
LVTLSGAEAYLTLPGGFESGVPSFLWLTSETMMDIIRERVKSLYPESEEIPFSMEASVIKDTSIFAIGIEASDPELTKVAANATAQVLVEENQKMF